MYGCKSWTIKKAEHQRIDAFELWCWRRLLRVPWTARGSNQSILKEISPEYSLEGLMLLLKLQYFGHLMRRADPLEKTLMLGLCWERFKVGGEGDDRGWDGWMASLTRWTWVWASSRGWWWTGRPGMLQSMGSHRVGHNWATELNWTEGFPGGSDGKESACNAGGLGLIPGLRRSPRGGPGHPLQYSRLENPHGQRSLAGYGPWSRKESDTTEQLSISQYRL